MYNWSKMSIGILGAGIENISLVNFLLKNNANVIVYDQGDPKIISEKLKDLDNPNLMIVAGKDYRRKISHHDIFFRSPGMLLSLAKRLTKGKGTLSSAMQLFFELCPAKIIGVTGTKGKGTTSALIYEILRHNIKCQISNVKKESNVYLLGNIGRAQFDDFEQITADDLVVMEMSSFQLEDMTLSPHIAVVLNITPDHLAPLSKNNPNFHKNFKIYAASKRTLVENQSKEDFAVLGLNDEIYKEFANKTKAKIFNIGELEQGCFLDDGKFWINNDGNKIEVADKNVLQIKGEHNLINAQAAIMASYLAGADVSAINAGLRSFKGLPHRLQFVKEIKKVSYYDDSYATDPDAAIAAIRTFKEPIILICGGSSKGADFHEFARVIGKSSVKAIVIAGDEAEKINQALDDEGVDSVRSYAFQGMAEMVSLAKYEANPGDVVLLSPACASFGLFLSASDRGNQFQRFVKSIG